MKAQLVEDDLHGRRSAVNDRRASLDLAGKTHSASAANTGRPTTSGIDSIYFNHYNDVCLTTQSHPVLVWTVATIYKSTSILDGFRSHSFTPQVSTGPPDPRAPPTGEFLLLTVTSC